MFHTMRKFLELQCLVDDLYKVDMGNGNEWNSILLHKVYIIFSQKHLWMT